MTERGETIAGLEQRQRWRRFAVTLLVYFICLELAVFALLFALANLLCFVAPSNRCFSFSKDTLGYLEIAAWHAGIGAMLIAFVAYFCHRLIWWHALVLMPLTIVIVAGMASWPVFREFRAFLEDPFNAETVLLLVPIVTGVGAMIAGALLAHSFCKSMYVVDEMLNKDSAHALN